MSVKKYWSSLGLSERTKIIVGGSKKGYKHAEQKWMSLPTHVKEKRIRKFM